MTSKSTATFFTSLTTIAYDQPANMYAAQPSKFTKRTPQGP